MANHKSLFKKVTQAKKQNKKSECPLSTDIAGNCSTVTFNYKCTNMVLMIYFSLYGAVSLQWLAIQFAIIARETAALNISIDVRPIHICKTFNSEFWHHPTDLLP